MESASAQIELDWSRTHTRVGDPSTSIRAAESVHESSRHQCAAILGELVTAHCALAAEPIADRLGMTTHAVGKRLPDLERDNLIRKTDEFHRNRSGRWAVKWEAVR